MPFRDDATMNRAAGCLLASVLALGCVDRPARQPSAAHDARHSQDPRAPKDAGTGAADTAAAERPRASPASRPRDVTFDDIKLDMEKGAPFSQDLLPKRVVSLGGERIRIRGYILPSFQQTGLTQFVLVRDNMECCFGPGAALHDCIVVRMRPGKTADFSVRPVAVAGTFRIEELRGPDGGHLAIYAMEGEEVR